MKFKVGDKVKVVKKGDVSLSLWVKDMNKFIGKEATVTRITEYENCYLNISSYIFPSESLELVPPITIDDIKQKIAELQDAVKRLEEEAKEEDNSVVVDDAFIAENLEVREYSEYKDKAIFLSRVCYDWELKEDSSGILCLIPTKKGDVK